MVKAVFKSTLHAQGMRTHTFEVIDKWGWSQKILIDYHYKTGFSNPRLLGESYKTPQKEEPTNP